MSNYRILLRGVRPGHSVDKVALALSRYSRKSPQALRALLTSGRYAVAKRTREAQQATRYKLFLERLGCDCVIEAERSVSNDSVNTTSVLVTEANDDYAGDVGPRRGVTYRQTSRLHELMRNRLRPRALAGLIALVALIYYYGWQYLP